MANSSTQTVVRRPVNPSRVLVVGEGASALYADLKASGLEVVDTEGDPHFVIAHGGDGSFLGAVREYPHLPIMAIRRDADYEKCPEHTNTAVFGRAREGTMNTSLLPRLVAEINGQKIYAINDIVFHNAHARSGVRYLVRIDGEPYSGEIVGDGVVVATPFGSSAYYRAITGSLNRVGIGLAFNNSTEATNHLVLEYGTLIELEVTRGPAILLGDNLIKHIEVEAGDIVRIRLSAQNAEIWELKTLTCKSCRERTSGKPAGWRHL